MMRAYDMIKLNVLKLLEEQGHTKYWLFKQLNMSYQNSIQKGWRVRYLQLKKLNQNLMKEGLIIDNNLRG